MPAFQTIPWSARQKQLESISQWTIQGTALIKSQSTSAHFSLYWEQKENNYHLEFFSPLGIKGVRIDGQPHSIVLQITGEPPIAAPNPEQLLQKKLGWTVPVSNLKYWIRAIPSPWYTSKQALDPYNHLILLEQKGWKIQYSDYHCAGSVDLPHQLRLTQGSLSLKIKITSWQIK